MLNGFLKPGFLQLVAAAGLTALALAAAADEKQPSARANVANVGTAAARPANPHTQSIEGNWKLLEEYCNECHNATDWAGGVAFDTLDPSTAAEDAEIWEESVRKLRGTLMPPPGKKQPDAAARAAFISSFENFLDSHAASQPRVGRVGLHRLNRTEYANAIEDILGVKIDASSLLPRDDKSDGFDNAADVLKVSPSFLEQYMAAAREVTVAAIGNPQARVQSRIYKGTGEYNPYMHMEGLPLGTRGGILFEHDFPADGEYEFTIGGLVGAGYLWGVMDPNTLIITIDGERIFEQKLGGPEDLKAVDVRQAEGVGEIDARFKSIRRHVKAGSHKVGITYVAKTAAEHIEVLHAFNPVVGMGVHVNGNSDGPRIQNVEIRGPFNPTGVSETPSRRKIFTCMPESAAEELPCARHLRGSRRRHGLLPAGPRAGRFRNRYPEGADGHPGEPQVPVPRAHAAAGGAAGRNVPHQ
jgi:cytochrome c5